jgi:hypothetical protein
MPGQFINTGNVSGGKLTLINVNNQGNLVMAPTPISFGSFTVVTTETDDIILTENGDILIID